ncbi:MAG: RusA family crossover junction endodeoxyribonuclease [Varibaculum timonense]
MKWIDPEKTWSFSFTVLGEPVTQGSMKIINGHAVPVKQAELRLWRREVLRSATQAHYGQRIATPLPLNEPVALDARFYLRRPNLPTFEDAATRPDLDKLVRSIDDGLAPLHGHKVLREDSRVIAINASKEYAKTNRVGDPEGPRAEITIYWFKNWKKGRRKKGNGRP